MQPFIEPWYLTSGLWRESEHYLNKHYQGLLLLPRDELEAYETVTAEQRGGHHPGDEAVRAANRHVHNRLRREGQIFLEYCGEVWLDDDLQKVWRDRDDNSQYVGTPGKFTFKKTNAALDVSELSNPKMMLAAE